MSEVVVTPGNTAIVIAEGEVRDIVVSPDQASNINIDSDVKDIVTDSVQTDVFVTAGNAFNLQLPDNDPTEVQVVASQSKIITIRRCDENGTPTGDKYYRFVQVGPSDTWIIDHGLDKEPAVQAFDNNKNRIFGDEDHESNNRLIIRWSQPVTGYVNFN